jgi:hypothetical protein
MLAHQRLLDQLTTLQAQQAEVRAQGIALFDCWIAQSKPAGTARTDNHHWQLRSRIAQFNGKKSRYLKRGEVAQYRAAIARGQKLKHIEQEIRSLRQQLARIDE